MNELLKSCSDLVKGIAKQPILSLLLIIFLVLIWVQVVKLDAINNTLMSIHEDNIELSEYIEAEREDTKIFVSELQELKIKIDMLLQR
jgi:hypothetical protein